MDAVTYRDETGTTPQWQPLAAIDRRIVGVLVEKAKTTADQYPLTVAALKAGANQKSNRYPLMQLEAEDIIEALDRLRGLGAVTEVQGGGRVPRYRHHMYQWLGVNKVELAIMAELLLRGAQTVGELRGRAARMEPIADLAALRPHLDALRAKGLVTNLTPEGRGCIVTHALYRSEELDRLRAKYGPTRPATEGSTTRPLQTPQAAHASQRAESPGTPRAAPGSTIEDCLTQIAELRREIETMRAEIECLKRQ